MGEQMNNSIVKIFVMTHKHFDIPSDKMYVPLQVGSAIHPHLGKEYLPDDTGNNISGLNPYFCELTGMYWIWQNIHMSGAKTKTASRDLDTADIVGIAHYRRYMVGTTPDGSEKIFNQNQIKEILSTHDIMCSSLITLSSDYYDGFAADHHLKDLITLSKVLEEKDPVSSEIFNKLVHGNKTYFGNILVTSKKIYDDYCAWLFDILFEVQKRTDMTGYNGYQMRLYGFLSEFLQMVYIRKNNLKVYESRIAMIGEKAETAEVKAGIGDYFLKGDYPGAKDFFMECYSKKPDLLMEASDVRGELKLCMQIISTCEYEMKHYGSTVLGKERELSALTYHFGKLNRVVQDFFEGSETKQDIDFISDNKLISDVAIEISANVVMQSDVDKVKAMSVIDKIKNYR